MKNLNKLAFLSLIVLIGCSNDELEKRLNENTITIQNLRNEITDLKAKNQVLESQLSQAKQGRIPTGVLAVDYSKVSEGQVVSRSDSGYQNALNLYRAGDIEAARKEFKNFLATGAQGEEAIMANYWLGDSAYSQRNYSEAAHYLGLFLKYKPESERTEIALKKLISSLKESGRTEEAQILQEQGTAAIQ